MFSALTTWLPRVRPTPISIQASYAPEELEEEVLLSERASQSHQA
jgi:hypothetical protein